MKKLLVIVAVLGICSLSCFAFNADDDPVASELARARESFATETKTALEKLSSAIESAIKETAVTGDLDAVEALRADQAAFEKSGKLPTSSQLRAAVAEHEKAVSKARESLRAALDKAVREYTKALKLEEAKAARAELARLEKKDAAPSATVKVPVSALSFEYKEYAWAFGQGPVKMIHKDEGFCFLTQVWGINSGNAEKGEVFIGEDGYWYLDGTTYQGREFLKLKAMSVKVRMKE
jgi:hypothetical protein